jgi:hypothetical protein
LIATEFFKPAGLRRRVFSFIAVSLGCLSRRSQAKADWMFLSEAAVFVNMLIN